MHERSIAREHRTPRAYAYTNSATIIAGSYARTGTTVAAIDGRERVEIHRRDRLDHKPREVILRQPLPHIGRHQKRLLTITRDKARTHTGIVLIVLCYVYSCRLVSGSGRRASSTVCQQVWQRPVQHLKIGCISSTA